MARRGEYKPKRKAVQDTERYKLTYLPLIAWAKAHAGNSPTVYGLAESEKMSYSTVRKHVNELIADGLLERRDGEIIIVGAEWYPPVSDTDGVREFAPPELAS
jgi:DNA-binding MarR family transcriptional regulator